MSTYRTKPRVKRSIFGWDHVCDLDIYGMRQQKPHGSGLTLDDSIYLVPGSWKGSLVGISKTCFGLHVRQLKTFVSGGLRRQISTKGTIADAEDTYQDFAGHRWSVGHVPSCFFIHHQTFLHRAEVSTSLYRPESTFSHAISPEIVNCHLLEGMCPLRL